MTCLSVFSMLLFTLQPWWDINSNVYRPEAKGQEHSLFDWQSGTENDLKCLKCYDMTGVLDLAGQRWLLYKCMCWDWECHREDTHTDCVSQLEQCGQAVGDAVKHRWLIPNHPEYKSNISAAGHFQNVSSEWMWCWMSADKDEDRSCHSSRGWQEDPMLWQMQTAGWRSSFPTELSPGSGCRWVVSPAGSSRSQPRVDRNDRGDAARISPFDLGIKRT